MAGSGGSARAAGSYPLAEAREHWGETYEGERWLGDRYLKALDILEAEARFWLEKWGAEEPVET